MGLRPGRAPIEVPEPRSTTRTTFCWSTGRLHHAMLAGFRGATLCVRSYPRDERRAPAVHRPTMADHRPSLLRLILVPTILTALISVARLGLEVAGTIPPTSGGALHPLGITWLALVFGAWFGWRLRRADSSPRLRPAWLWMLLGFAAVAGTVVWQFSGIDRTDTSPEATARLEAAIGPIVMVSAAAGVWAFVVWTRLALTLLLYAIPARLTVVALTAMAHQAGWETHYTKFGPAGLEYEFAEAMQRAAGAQLVFWPLFTIVAGGFCGAVAAGFARRK